MVTVTGTMWSLILPPPPPHWTYSLLRERQAQFTYVLPWENCTCLCRTMWSLILPTPLSLYTELGRGGMWQHATISHGRLQTIRRWTSDFLLSRRGTSPLSTQTWENYMYFVLNFTPADGGGHPWSSNVPGFHRLSRDTSWHTCVYTCTYMYIYTCSCQLVGEAVLNRVMSRIALGSMPHTSWHSTFIVMSIQPLAL